MALLIALALGAPPEGVDYEDAKLWEGHADRALDGPAGCWLMTGNSQSTLTISSAVSMWGRSDVTTITSIGKWEGRLEDGEWTKLAYTLVSGESGEQDGYPVKPLLGRADDEMIQVNGKPWLSEDDKERRAKRRARRDDEDADEEGSKAKTSPKDPDDGESAEGKEKSITVSAGSDGAKASSEGSGGSAGSTAANTLRSIIDGLDTSTAISTADWRESIQAVQLDQDVPLTDDNPDILVHITSIFPNGQPDPIRISAKFPKSATFGSFPTRITIYDGQLHVVQHPVRDRVLPIAERSSAVVNALGFKVGVDQKLDYTSARPCN